MSAAVVPEDRQSWFLADRMNECVSVILEGKLDRYQLMDESIDTTVMSTLHSDMYPTSPSEVNFTFNLDQ
ncbi:hypothetical protein J6590_087836 [Homalodisca vitripennis]|nr:hypothetical protein J6590_087836 [Homalodisca vitripennis]